MELEGDPTGLHLKEQVHVSLQAHQCSLGNVAPNPSICELSPWLRVSRWHELAVNHIILAGMPLDHIKRASVLDALLGPGVNPLEGSPNVKLRKLGPKGTLPTSNSKRG